VFAEYRIEVIVGKEMKKTLQTLTLLKSEGFFEDYAVGGAVAAFFYIEPTLTEDLDVFIAIKDGNAPIISLSPIYKRLEQLGYFDFEKEEVLIDKWAVQFLPVSTGLEKEPLDKASEKVIEGETIRVFSQEHLMAICVSVGRPKDKIRLSQFIESDSYDKLVFQDLLERHGLKEKWKKIEALISDDKSN